MVATEELLEAVWGEGYHSLCARHAAGRFRTVDVFADPANMLVAAGQLNGDEVWFGVHGMAEVPLRRGGATDVTSVVVLAADIDWHDPAHHAEGLPMQEEVRSRLGRLGELAPSVVVNSGHGLQLYWLLSENVGARHGAELQLRLDLALAEVGLTNERSDLASVLRLPGSTNHKTEPVPVVIERADLERRFVREWLDKRLPRIKARSGTRAASRPPRILDDRDEAAVALLLEHFHGHSPVVLSDHIEVTRPGKPSDSSASVGMLGPGVTKVWTPNWPPFTQDQVLSLHELRKLAGVAEPRVHAPGLPPPEGYRWWRAGDADTPKPVLGEAVYHGPLGEYLNLVDGNTEAHPAPIGFGVLAHLGMHFGSALAYQARDIVHHPNLWGINVGPTSSGGKGVAHGEVKGLLGQIDPFLVERHTLSGFGSGPAFVDAVRDTKDDEEPKEKCRLVSDQEMAGVFRVCLMRDSTLSETLRKAFDGERLESRTRGHGQVVATGHHIGVFGAITAEELVTMMDEGSIRNGLGGRFLYLWCELTALLPFGGRYDLVQRARLADVIADRVTASFGRVYDIQASPEVEAMWSEWYFARRLGVGRGAVLPLTARHHAHAARLMILYAALDGAATLRPEHVRAAIAWCDYSWATTELVFGDGIVGQGRRLLDAIRAAGSSGLTRTDQSAVFGRNLTAERLDAIRADLEAAHLIVSFDVRTEGRDTSTAFPITPLRDVRKNERDER